ncbi:MAG: type II secretion system F family protein [Crocinitomicaceae bacterium]|nr:type II secretion system F family protein [Crocinitomicaceae bacterium]MCF8434373.1 type II secretion system F family protein [Crocinitomicaceae bacterium]
MVETAQQPLSFFQQEIKFGKAFPDKLKEGFYTEFTSLLESGIDIQRALNLLVEEQENKKVLSILDGIRSDLIGGSTLAEAMKKSGHFISYEYQSIRIGEETGQLKNVLHHLAKFFSDKVKLKRQLIGVFTYPAFVFLITIGVLYFMLNSVVPMFEDVFKQFGQELPFLTKKIIWLSKHFTTFFMIFLGITILMFIYGYYSRKEIWFRSITSRIVLKIPVFGILIEKIYLARMCQSMSLLLSARTPLINALDLVEEMIGFYPIEHAIHEVKNDIRKGESLHQGMSKFPIFNKRLISLTKIAEEINQLDLTYDRLAKQYQEDIDFRTKLIGTIIEPLIIVVIGLIVGVIMVSMYLPMFNLSNVIK